MRLLDLSAVREMLKQRGPEGVEELLLSFAFDFAYLAVNKLEQTIARRRVKSRAMKARDRLDEILKYIGSKKVGMMEV